MITQKFRSPYLAALAALASRLDARMEFKWPEFKKKEEIPEAFRDAYTETDGKFVHTPDEPSDDRNPDKLKVALDKERKRADDAEKETKAEKKKVKDLEAEVAGKTTVKEERDKIRFEANKEKDEEFAPTLKERDALKSEVRDLKLDSQVKALAIKNGVRPERVDRWWKLNKDQFDIAEDGSTAIVKNKSGADIGKYIGNDLKKVDPDFYTGTQAGGGGATGSGGSGSGTATVTAEAVLANPAAALQAARTAGKTSYALALVAGG